MNLIPAIVLGSLHCNRASRWAALSVPLLFALSASVSRAQFTATYTFTTSATDVPTVANVTFTALAATNVTLSYSSANQNTSTGQWTAGLGVADTTEFLSFGVQANPGYVLNLSQLSFKASRSGTGPPNISMDIFVGGVSQGVSGSFTPTNTSTATTTAMGSALTYNFTDLTSVVATNLVQFRIYGWGGTGSTGTLRLDDLSLSGAVNLTAIPEPSTYALALSTAAFLAILARRKGKPKPDIRQ